MEKRFAIEKDRVYFRFSDPVYKRLYRKKSSRPNKMLTRNKTKNSSRIKIIEVARSCCVFLYELYRRKVHEATLAISAHREFLGVMPLRFCEKVGFFSGTDKATAKGGTSLEGSGGMLPHKILKIAMQIEPFYSIWARIHYFFPC